MPSLMNNSEEKQPIVPFYEEKFFIDGKIHSIELDETTTDSIDKTWTYAKNEAGETRVHLAGKHSYLQVLKSSLSFYNNTEMTDKIGNTVLHILADHNVEDNIKTKNERVDLLRDLINKGAKVDQQNEKGWALVHFAAKHGNIDLLKILKENGADFNLKTKKNETPLLIACKYMFEKVNTSLEKQTIDFLIDQISDINATDENGITSLHYAAERCCSQTVKKLLENNANPHLCTLEHKITPLHFAAMKERNLQSVIILLKAGTTIQSQEIDELAPLHLALIEGSPDIIKYLINNGTDVNYPDKILQLTPLCLAFYQQRLDLFKLLINAGADVNSIVKDDLTILHLTSMLGSYEFTKALIDGGADINCKSDDEFTPLHLATVKSRFQIDNELIIDDIRACHGGSLIVELLTYPQNKVDRNYKSVIELLLCSGAEVNALTSNGWSSLHLAVELNQYTAVDILLKYGATVNSRETDSGLTPLNSALKNFSEAIVELLINADADVNALTPEGKSPIHLALENNRIDSLKLIIQAGADVNYEEPNSKLTPLHMALLKNNRITTTMLINAGADVNILTPDRKSPIQLNLESNNFKEEYYLTNRTHGTNLVSLEHTEVLKLMIDNCADVNYMDPNSKLTALHFALIKGYRAAAKILINTGADVKILTGDGKSSLHLILESGSYEKDIFEYGIVLKQLVSRGADVNYVDPFSKLTPLHVALKKKYNSAATILIDAGADIEALTPDGKKPIYLSLSLYDTKILKLLIDLGTDINCREINSQLTLLHQAIYDNYFDAVEILINYGGVDVNALTLKGESPLHLALELNRREISNILIENDAKLTCKISRCLYTPFYVTKMIDDQKLQKENNHCNILEFMRDKIANVLPKCIGRDKKKIKKAILQLSAFLDTNNKKKSMIVRPDVHECCIKNSNCHMIDCKIDPHDFETYKNFIYFQVFNSSFSKNDKKKLACGNSCLSEYLVMLNAIKLPLSYIFEAIQPPDEPELVHEFEAQINQYFVEVAKLAGYSIANGVTLHDLFHMTPGCRRTYTKNLNLSDISKKFKIYYKMILIFYYEDKIKTSLKESFYWAFPRIINQHLPTLCLDEIFNDLDVAEIISVIRAVEGIDLKMTSKKNKNQEKMKKIKEKIKEKLK